MRHALHPAGHAYHGGAGVTYDPRTVGARVRAAQVPSDERCQFSTTRPKGAMSQAAMRGSATRYERCRNRARHTITVSNSSLAHPDATREVRCCGLHRRLHETKGWLP
jgi:hypothetical protein